MCVILGFVRSQRTPCKMVSVVTSIVQTGVEAEKEYSGFEEYRFATCLPLEVPIFSAVELGH